MSSVTEPAPQLKFTGAGVRTVLWTVFAAHESLDAVARLREQLLESVDEILDQTLLFVLAPPTPEGMWRFEHVVAKAVREMGRVTVEFAVNHIEPADTAHVPKRLRRGSEEFSRKGSKTAQRGGVACLFGVIALWRWSYEPLREERDAGLVSIAPLVEQLGLVAGSATPALAEVVGWQAQERSERAVVKYLADTHAVRLAAATVVKIRDALAEGFANHLQAQQLALLRTHLDEARRLGKVIIAVGRDGIFLPMRGAANDHWKEAAVGTVSVYAKPRRGRLKRLGTVYLGQMPQPGQQELTADLTALLRQLLSDESARDARLVYVTDAGHHPEEYFQTTLQNMENPLSPGKKLTWIRIVDFYHAATRLSELADVLFRDAKQAQAWARRMRRVLKNKLNAIHRILHSAAALRPGDLSAKAKDTYRTAYNYLLNHREGMDYAAFRANHLPIGSGVTEAACKTVFTQRFKCSGMMWNRHDDYDHQDPTAVISGARAVLILRLAALSGVYQETFQAYLATRGQEAKTLSKAPIFIGTTQEAA